MPESRPPRVFLSYASDDRDLALRLANELRQFGIDVWFDAYNLAPGDDWRSAITEALELPVSSWSWLPQAALSHTG